MNYLDLLGDFRTCAYHQSMKYCPVLIKINHDTLKQYFGGNEYLLQVFNNDGVCVFKKYLKCKSELLFFS